MAASILHLLFMVVIMTVFILFRTKSGKLHSAYLVFPLLSILSFFLTSQQVINCKCETEEIGTAQGLVYKVKESQYGYQLYIRKNIFDKKRYIVYSNEYIDMGKYIVITGKIEGFDYTRNPGEFNSLMYYNSKNVVGKIKANKIEIVPEKENYIYISAGIIREKLSNVFDEICENKYAAVFSAMLLGKKDDLDIDLQDLFSASGIGHILAISGLHISLIGMGLYGVLRKLNLNFIFSMILSTGIILYYGIIVGNEISTIRAVIMFIVSCYAKVLGKTYDMISAASLACIISVLYSPLLIFNCSFLLSYLAVVGIVYIYGTFVKIINTKNKILQCALSGFSIQLGTLPVTLYYFYRIPLLSVFFNILVIPLMTYVMIFSILAVLIGCFCKKIGEIIILPSVLIIKLFEYMCGLGKRLPELIYTSGQPNLLRIFIYCCLLICFIYIGKKFAKKYCLLIIPIAVSVLVIKYNSYFKISFVDVGQGDCVYIHNDNNLNILVDGGSSDVKNIYSRSIEPYLLSVGCAHLDYVIVTHCDNDHVSGIKELLSGDKIMVDTLLMPHTTLVDSEYEELVNLAYSKNVKMDYIYENVAISSGRLNIMCVHPEYNFDTNERNEYSTTLYVTYKDLSILLTGDISEKIEKLIVDKQKDIHNISILKAAHHGSRFSNSDVFLDYFSPKEVIISCGIDNSYGHPHKETIDRFNERGIRMWQTNLNGCISVSCNNDTWRIGTHIS